MVIGELKAPVCRVTMASAAVQSRDLEPQLSEDDDDDLGDAIWDALCEDSADAVSEPEVCWNVDHSQGLFSTPCSES